MIQVTPQMKILVAVEPVDFRFGIDRLTRVCREVLASDPFAGVLFVFKNRRATSLKLICYDGQGFWECKKRLSRGRFAWWPESAEAKRSLDAHELQTLLWNGDPTQTRAAPFWRKVAAGG
jgi:transposase